MINNLKEYVKTQLLTYVKVKDGLQVEVLEIDSNGSDFDFEDKPNKPCLDWYYNIFVVASVNMGVRNQRSREYLDEVTEQYRKAVSEQYAFKEWLTVDNETDKVQITGIDRFIRTLDTERKQWTFNIALTFRHIEVY